MWGKWLFPYFCAMNAASRRHTLGTGRSLSVPDVVLKLLMAASATAQLPKLAEEAQASVRGCAAIGKVVGMKEALKSGVQFTVAFCS